MAPYSPATGRRARCSAGTELDDPVLDDCGSRYWTDRLRQRRDSDTCQVDRYPGTSSDPLRTRELN